MSDIQVGPVEKPAEPNRNNLWLSSKVPLINKLGPKGIFTSLALALSLFAYIGVFDLLLDLSPVPGLETEAEAYFEDTRERVAYTYVSARLLNGAISVLQGINVSAGIVGAEPFQFLDPVDDLVEKFSTIMLISLASVLTQELLLKIGSGIAFSSILPIAFLILATKPWLPTGMQRKSLGLFYGIVALMLVAKLFSPVTGAIGSYVSEEFLIADYNTAAADIKRAQLGLSAQSTELPSSEEINNTLDAQNAQNDAQLENSQVSIAPVEIKEPSPLETEKPVLEINVPPMATISLQEPEPDNSDINTSEGQPAEGTNEAETSEAETGGFLSKITNIYDTTKTVANDAVDSAVAGTKTLIDNPVDVTAQFAADTAEATKNLAVDAMSATSDAAIATKDMTVDAAKATAEVTVDAAAATGTFVGNSFKSAKNILPTFSFPDAQGIKQSMGNIADSILVMIKIFVFEVLLLPLITGFILYKTVRSILHVGGVYEQQPSAQNMILSSQNS